MTLHWTLAALSVGLGFGLARADPMPTKDQFAEIDKARIAIVAALDKGDGVELAKYIGKELKLERVWFDNAACRNKFGNAKVTAKQAPGLAKCFGGIKVWQEGLNLHYGPGVLLNNRLKIEDGKPVLWSLSGDVITSNTTLPYIWQQTFRDARTAGDATVALDQTALDELASIGEKGFVYDVCIDGKGTVRKTDVMLSLPKNGAVAKQLKASAKNWAFSPFELRGEPTAVCATIVQKL